MNLRLMKPPSEPLFNEHELDRIAIDVSGAAIDRLWPTLIARVIVNANMVDADDDSLMNLLAKNGFTSFEIKKHLPAALDSLTPIRRA